MKLGRFQIDTDKNQRKALYKAQGLQLFAYASEVSLRVVVKIVKAARVEQLRIHPCCAASNHSKSR